MGFALNQNNKTVITMNTTSKTNSMKWNWDAHNNREKISGSRVRISLTEKSQNHTMTLGMDLFHALGSPKRVCIGVGRDGIFITSQKYGTSINVSKQGRSCAPVIASKSVVEAIFSYFDMDFNKSGVLDLDFTPVEDYVFRLTPKGANKFGFL
jgi:hypothetical protein